MSEEVVSKTKLEERYKKVLIRTEETVHPFSGEKEKRHVVDLIHEGNTYSTSTLKFLPSGQHTRATWARSCSSPDMASEYSREITSILNTGVKRLPLHGADIMNENSTSKT